MRAVFCCLALLLMPIAGAEETKEPVELTRLRSQFETKVNSIVAQWQEKYRQELKKLEERLAREGRLHEALAVRKEQETENALRRAATSEPEKATLPAELSDLIPGSVWEYSQTVGSVEEKGYLLFFKGGNLMLTSPNAGPGTWELLKDDSVEVKIGAYPAVQFQISKDRFALTCDSGGAKRRAKLLAIAASK